MLPDQAELVGVTVIMEPTRNAWVPGAAWVRRRGATVVLVPPEQAADLRASYHKPTKTGRLDSRLLPGYRCCTPTVCTPSTALALAMCCGGRPSCAPPWSNGAAPPQPPGRAAGAARAGLADGVPRRPCQQDTAAVLRGRLRLPYTLRASRHQVR
jgi:hypothetical protein